MSDPRVRRLLDTDVIAQVPFFRGMDDEVTLLVCEHLKLFNILKGDNVFEKGDRSSDLIILHTGIIEEHIPGEEVVQYKAGSFFGELEFLKLPGHDARSMTIVAKTHVACSSLSPEALDSVILARAPKLKQQIEAYGVLREKVSLLDAVCVFSVLFVMRELVAQDLLHHFCSD